MLEFFPYSLSLKTPIPLPGGVRMSRREGLLIHNTDTGGWGDAAPLPGFSRETVAEVLVEAEAGELQGSRFPSVRFALECAAESWKEKAVQVPVNALWFAEAEPVSDLLNRLQNWKAPCIKIKPGPHPDPELWMQLLEERPDATLRIDPNRGWTVDQLQTFCEPLPLGRLEYVEEPFSDPEDYRSLPMEFPIPLALDEQTREEGGRALAELSVIKALVLKPTLLGNAEDRSPWLSLAVRRGLKVTWSSSFESGVGLWHLARLAAGGGAAGLDTGGVFEADVVSPRPVSDDGALFLAETLKIHV